MQGNLHDGSQPFIADDQDMMTAGFEGKVRDMTQTRRERHHIPGFKLLDEAQLFVSQQDVNAIFPKPVAQSRL